MRAYRIPMLRRTSSLSLSSLSTMLNIFFSETAWPVKAKLHAEHPSEEGTKVNSNGPGHLTKMADRAIDSKILLNFLLQSQKVFEYKT